MSLRAMSIYATGLGLAACGSSGSPGDGGGGACATTGAGTIVVEVSGLPATSSPDVTLTGPAGDQAVTAASQTFSSAAAGSYVVAAGDVSAADPIVRTLYRGTVTGSTFCLAAGASTTIQVAYAAVPTSNKLWVTNGSGGTGTPLAFASSSLAASGSPAATVAAQTTSGRDVAFDQAGNLWTFGATDATLQRYPASSLGAGGTSAPDRTIALPIACVPPTTGLAFDPAGNLWVSSTCAKTVSRLTPGDIAASGSVTPAVSLALPQSAAGLAFDQAGNLWASDPDDTHLFRFDAASLAASGAAPSLTLTTTGPQSVTFSPSWLAFDASGALWANDFGGNVIYALGPTALTGTGARTVAAPITITLQAGALLESMAFDEGGGLWVAYSAGKFARLGPAQLLTSTDAGSPTIPGVIVSSGDVGYVGNLAFFPAPAALPLYSAIP